MLAAAGF